MKEKNPFDMSQQLFSFLCIGAFVNVGVVGYKREAVGEKTDMVGGIRGRSVCRSADVYLSLPVMSYETDNGSSLLKLQRSEDVLDVSKDRQMEICITLLVFLKAAAGMISSMLAFFLGTLLTTTK